MQVFSSKYHFGLKHIIFLIFISFLLLPNKSHSLDFCKIDNKNYSCPSLSTYNLCENSLTFNGLNFEKGKTNFIKEMKNSFLDLQISHLKSDSIKKDFNIIRSSKLAILSNSTFSWWASFLSKSKKEFLVPSNFSVQEKRIILPNETVIF